MTTPPDRDLDTLAERLSRCLGEVDLALEQLIDAGPVDPEATAAAIEHRAAELHSLVARITAAGVAAVSADVDRLVAAGVAAVLPSLGFPVVVRTHLAGNLPPVPCRPAELDHAIRRALNLAAAHAGAGGELTVTTASSGGGVAIGIAAEAVNDPAADHLRERALTLQAFVASWHGRCRFEQPDARRLHFCLELPGDVTAGR